MNSNVTWHPGTEPPERRGGIYGNMSRMVLIVVDNGENTVDFGWHVHGIGLWKRRNSPSDWKVKWWAEIPEAPND